MFSARSDRFGVPVLPFPAFLSWYIAGDGRILTTDGTAAAEYSSEIAEVIGCQFREVLPFAAARRVERAMSGEAVAEFGDTWGGRWFNLVTPSVCGWGVDGWSILLPDEIGQTVRAVYESVGPDPDFSIEAGDRFVRRPSVEGVSVVRQWGEERWRDYLADRPDRIRAILTQSDAPPPPTAAYPPLRLLPP